MPDDAATILDALKRAFPAKRPPPFAELVSSTRGDEPAEVAQAFADKTDWTALDGDWLEQLPIALSFFSHEAIRFYIPAYIAADIAGKLHNTDVVFALTHGFAQGVGDARIRPRAPHTWGDYARERWSRLTAPQIQAIARYLEWRSASRSTPYDREIIGEALASYWRARAAGI